MSRFRLRFLLQEFDLPVGEVLIGRSPDCHVTIEDPLISREHAKILVTPETAVFYDLSSRNGSRINGVPVRAPTPLADSDRIRLGAQELVFFQTGTAKRNDRKTGAMIVCRRCGTPYPEGAKVCPHCGTPPGVHEDVTISGVIVEPKRTWSLQLMVEVIERALRARKPNEAERVLQRAALECRDRVAQGDPDWVLLAQVSEYAIRLAQLQNASRWVEWVLESYELASRVPTAVVMEGLGEARDLEGMAERLATAAKKWLDSDTDLSPEDRAAVAKLHASLGSPPS